ncbi:MAG: hypothetical protein KDC42_04845 [Ignavibacteriae bacterium]|nr:hypothetical protein [Ignavibacteriota bacterium]
MIKNLGLLAVAAVLTVSLVTMMSCGDSTKENQSSGKNSDLLIKDDKGEKVKLLIKPQEKDTLRYKMVAKQSETEKGTTEKEGSITVEQEISYYYSQVVDRVEDNAVSYRMQYDSIQIVSKIQSPDSTVTIIYNSNVKDSIYNYPDFIQFNATIGTPFYMRVSDKGTVLDLYGMEKIYDNIYKALGDTLSPNDKSVVQNSIGESMKAVLQQQFQKFPDSNEVYKDSSWTSSYETQLSVFPVKNILGYKITDIKEEDGNILITIDASLSTEVIKKEITEKNTKAVLDNLEAKGSGTIIYNLSRGCIKSKQTQTDLKAKVTLSQGSQSLTTDKDQTSSVIVERL